MIKNLIILVLGFLVWVAYIDDTFSMEPEVSKISLTSKNAIKKINTVKNIYRISIPGTNEEILIKMKDILNQRHG